MIDVETRPACPTCGATGFEECRTTSGRTRFDAHAKRKLELARAAAKVEAEERALLIERRLPDVIVLRDYHGAIVGTFHPRPARQLYRRARCTGRARRPLKPAIRNGPQSQRR